MNFSKGKWPHYMGDLTAEFSEFSSGGCSAAGTAGAAFGGTDRRPSRGSPERRSREEAEDLRVKWVQGSTIFYDFFIGLVFGLRLGAIDADPGAPAQSANSNFQLCVARASRVSVSLVSTAFVSDSRVTHSKSCHQVPLPLVRRRWRCRRRPCRCGSW